MVHFRKSSVDALADELGMDEVIPSSSGNRIHPSAVIAPGAALGRDNVIGPNVFVGSRVDLGDRNILHPGVVIGIPSRQRLVGDATKPDPSCDFIIKIGSDNVFYEYTSIHYPMKSQTLIENMNVIGARNHVSHDCRFGSNITSAANSCFGGYVCIGDYCNIGLGVNIHPRVVFGSGAIAGVGASIIEHVLPNTMVAGVPARLLGLNRIGLSRRNFTETSIQLLDDHIRNGGPLPLEFEAIFEVHNSLVNVSGRHQGPEES